MSLLLSEDVSKYRELEISIMVKVIHDVMVNTDARTLQVARGKMEAIKQIINLPMAIAATPEEKLYAKELIGKTKALLADKLAGKYLFEE